MLFKVSTHTDTHTVEDSRTGSFTRDTFINPTRTNIFVILRESDLEKTQT